MTGILVAMDKELKLLLPLLSDIKELQVEGNTYYTGTVGGSSVVVAKCGIGKVNSTLVTDEMIRNFSPSLVINTGVAGGAGNGAGILDVVVGDRIAYHDVWCGSGTRWGRAADCPLYFESSRKVTLLPCLTEGGAVRHGLICSGDIFVDSPRVVAAIRQRFPDVMAIDMESAAVAHTCYKRGVEFACIRVLSDTPGDTANNIAQYDNFWDDAPASTFRILSRVLEEIR